MVSTPCSTSASIRISEPFFTMRNRLLSMSVTLICGTGYAWALFHPISPARLPRTFALSFPAVLHQPTALSIMGSGRYFFRSQPRIFLNVVVYIIKCHVFSECQRLFRLQNMRKLSCIFLCRHTTQCQTCAVLYSGKLCDFHKRRRCSRMAAPLPSRHANFILRGHLRRARWGNGRRASWTRLVVTIRN